MISETQKNQLEIRIRTSVEKGFLAAVNQERKDAGSMLFRGAQIIFPQGSSQKALVDLYTNEILNWIREVI